MGLLSSTIVPTPFVFLYIPSFYSQVLLYYSHPLPGNSTHVLIFSLLTPVFRFCILFGIYDNRWPENTSSAKLISPSRLGKCGQYPVVHLSIALVTIDRVGCHHAP